MSEPIVSVRADAAAMEYMRENRAVWTYFWPFSVAYERGFVDGAVVWRDVIPEANRGSEG